LCYPGYDTDPAGRGLCRRDSDVAPEAGRRGVGRALMAAVARACQAEGGCYLFWNAQPRNRAGRAFYRAIGAREEPVLTLSLQPDALGRPAQGGAASAQHLARRHARPLSALGQAIVSPTLVELIGQPVTGSPD